MEYPSYLNRPSPDSGSSNSTSSLTVHRLSTKSTGYARGTACDQCHRCKVRCSGRTPSCERCSRYQSACTYSLGKPLGKPKGRKDNTPENATRQHSSTSAGNDMSRESSRIPDEPAEGPQDGSNKPTPFRRSMQNTPAESPSDLRAVANLDALDALDPLNSFSPNNFEVSLGSSSYSPDAFTTFGMASCNRRSIGNTEDNSGARFPLVMRNSNPPQLNKHVAQQQLNSLSPTGRLFPVRADFENTASPSETGGNLLLQIITQLHNQQLSVAWAPIDSTLAIARQGLDNVSRYISDVSSASGPAPASSSLVIACLLILQLSLSCYAELRSQAAKRFEQNGTGQQHNAETLCVGGFTIEDSESCRSVLDALAIAEGRRGQFILVRLRRVARDLKGAGDDYTGLLELLMDSDEAWSSGNSYHNSLI